MPATSTFRMNDAMLFAPGYSFISSRNPTTR